MRVGATGGGATLEGESEGWELGVGLPWKVRVMGVGLPWNVRVRVGNYWGWAYKVTEQICAS